MQSGTPFSLKKSTTLKQSQQEQFQKTISISKQRRNEMIAKRRHVQEEESDVSSVMSEPGDYQSLLRKYSEDLKGSNTGRYEKAIKRIRMLLSVSIKFSDSLLMSNIEDNPPIDAIIKLDLLPYIIRLLRYEENPTIQLEAAWALTNIASGNTMQTYLLVQSSCQREFVRLLSSSNREIKKQALWGISNIQGDYSQYTRLFRKELIECNGLESLIQILSDSNTDQDILQIASICIANICRGKEEDPEIYSLIPYQKLISLFISLLTKYPTDNEIVSPVSYAVSFIAEKSSEMKEMISQTSLIPILISFLSSSEKQILYPCFHTLSLLIAESKDYTQICIDFHIIPAICTLLMDPRPFMKFEIVYTISNIAVGDSLQIQALIDSDILELLISYALEGSFDIKKEACWGICNALCNCTMEQGVQITDLGVISPLCSMLLPSLNVELYTLIAETILVIIDFGNYKQTTLGLKTNPYVDQLFETDIISALESATYRDAHLWKAIHDLLDVLERYNTEDQFNDLFTIF